MSKLGFVVASLLAASTCALGACGGERISPFTAGGDDGGLAAPDGSALADGGAAGADGGAAVLDGGRADGGGGGATCRPDADATFTRAELPLVLGATTTFAVNHDGTVVTGVDTAGRATDGGARIWDFSAANTNDHRVLDEVIAPAGAWWAASYADATFAAPLGTAGTLLGVYRLADTELLLLGTVSREANRTNLSLSPAVPVLRFPLSRGQQWSVRATGSGVVDWVPVGNVNDYTFSVDGEGEVWTPAARFPALRLRIELTQSIPLTLFSRSARTYLFLSPCWGVVARIQSEDGEASREFTRATEYRRVAP